MATAGRPVTSQDQRRPARARQVIALGLVAALSGAAGLAFHRVFGWRGLMPVVVVAACVPALLAALVPRARLPLNVLAWLVTTSETLFRAGRGIPSAGTIAAEARGVRDAWKGMLTTVLPAPPRPELLVGVQVLTWLAAVAGAEIVLRTRAAAAPAAPAFGAFAVALLIGADGVGSNLPTAVALVLLTGCLILVRSGWPPQALTVGLPATACLAAAGAAVGPALPFIPASQFDLREHVAQPRPLTREEISPLDEVSAWLLNPATPLFTVRAPRPENWRLAVLDRFDGATWSTGARFIPSGGRVPPGTSEAPAVPVPQTITIGGLNGTWLPAADRPAQVTGAGMETDPGSGALVAAQSLHAGETYQVLSEVSEYTNAELRTAVPADDADARAALEMPPGGSAFTAYAQAATVGASFPFQQALRLAGYLRAHESYDVNAAPGHAYRNLEFFLTTTHAGTSEQFATAFAVMARALGLPSRVVVGFRPGTPVPGGWHVTGGDVLVWPEIDFSGLGWVPFYPTPRRSADGSGAGPAPAGETTQRQLADQQAERSAPVGAPAAARPVRVRPHGGSAAWELAAAAVVVAVLGYGAAVLLVPPTRDYRRRRRAAPAGRIAGAWLTTVERLRDAGQPPEPGMTAHEIATLGGRRAQSCLLPLADIVNWSGYAPVPPTEQMAGEAWRLARSIRRLVPRPAVRRLHPRVLVPARQTGAQPGTASRMQAGADHATADGLPNATTAPTMKQ
jgi:hypothetical protein